MGKRGREIKGRGTGIDQMSSKWVGEVTSLGGWETRKGGGGRKSEHIEGRGIKGCDVY